jgi:hypothetical protein
MYAPAGASQELSRVSCTLPVLHCTDDSQQTVEKGHLRHFERVSAISALAPIVLQKSAARRPIAKNGQY